MTRSVICGQTGVFFAHGGRLFLGAKVLVALKIANTVASMESTIKLQAKLMPLRKIFAIRTLVLTFCTMSVKWSCWMEFRERTYQILLLLLLGHRFPLLQHLLFPERRAEDHRLCRSWGSSWRFECALEW